MQVVLAPGGHALRPSLSNSKATDADTVADAGTLPTILLPIKKGTNSFF